MKESEKNSTSETKSNSIEYLEDNSNISNLNKDRNENNNIISVNETKNNFQNENLKTVTIENSNNSINEFIIPQELKKTFRFTIILTITGIILIICGITKSIITNKVLGGLMFWILAILVLIPGGFYSYQFCKARQTQKEYERQEIFDSIPKL